MRERGDGLPDGGQPLGLDHGRVVAGVFDGQGRLVADGDHQLQVVFGELVGAALLDALLGAGRGVDVDHADHVVAALHGHANRLADAHLHDAAGGIPAVVLPGVAGQHAFVPLDHVVENRLADGDFLVGADALASAADLGLQQFCRRVHQHDAAAVGLDPLEDQLHDPLQQLVDVQRVADGQRRAVHHLQVAPRPGEPGVLRHFGLRIEDPAAFFLGDRMDDPRAVVLFRGRTDVDRFWPGLLRSPRRDR